MYAGVAKSVKAGALEAPGLMALRVRAPSPAPLTLTQQRNYIMALHIHPNAGALVICDFAGFRAPEMVKKRPVVVVSPRPRRRTQIVTVVPLSTTAPNPVLPCHHMMNPDSLPARYRNHDNWAKCDMVCAVSLARLDRVFAGRDENNKRQYVIGQVTEADLETIRRCIGKWLRI